MHTYTRSVGIGSIGSVYICVYIVRERGGGGAGGKGGVGGGGGGGVGGGGGACVVSV